MTFIGLDSAVTMLTESIPNSAPFHVGIGRGVNGQLIFEGNVSHPDLLDPIQRFASTPAELTASLLGGIRDAQEHEAQLRAAVEGKLVK